MILRLIIGAALVFGSVALWYWHDETGIIDVLSQPDEIKRWAADLGIFGPAAIATLMAAAIVVSPLPSAPIALAAGAAYGHTWGTIYILIGAEIGALIAFFLARVLGKSFIDRWVGDRFEGTMVGTQNGLTLIVLVTRLVPFMSFDVVSYAAGLTAITTARFALATLAGMMPASFVLAHFGAELTNADSSRVFAALMLMAALMLIPIVIHAAIKRRRHAQQRGSL